MLRMVEALPLHCVRDMHGVKAESRMFVAACMGRSSRPLMKFVAMQSCVDAFKGATEEGSRSEQVAGVAKRQASACN